MSDTQIAVHTVPKASDQLASFLGIEKGMMIQTLKAQCFKGKRPDEVTDEQLAAFVSTANILQVNPLVPGMLYAYPERNGGITPILGPDGVFKKLDEMVSSGKLAGFECEVENDKDGKPLCAHATIYRVGDQKPAKYTAWFSEWSVTSNPNWQSRPRHMLWVRAIKQAARQVIHGLPMDADEYAIAEMQNVTGTADAPADVPAKERPAPKPRQAKGAAAVVENRAPAAAEKVAATIDAEIVPPEEVKAAQEPAKAAEKEPVKEVQHVRATLNDGETYETTLTVETVSPLIANLPAADGTRKPTPSVRVKGRGGFIGEFYHFSGATGEGEALTPLPIWTVGNAVKVKLSAKKNAKGVIIVRVEEAVAGNAAIDVE